MRGTKERREAKVAELLKQLAETEAELEEVLGADEGEAAAGGERIKWPQAEVRFRRLLDRLPTLVFELAPEGTILAINPAVTAATGFLREELLGENWWDVFCPRQFGRRAAELQWQLQSGDVTGYEIAVLPRSGVPLALELTTANWYGPAGELLRVVGIAIDVTARRNAEELLQQGRYTLERRIAERTEALSEARRAAEQRAAEAEEGRRIVEALQKQHEVYLHTISHDLRVPLTVVYGHAQLVKRNLEASNPLEAHQNLDLVLRSAERMNYMIEDLVDAARLEGGGLILEKEEIPLEIFVREFLGRSSLALEVDRIQVEIAADLPPVEADADRLERILLNLLSNALKFSQRSSAVRLSAFQADREICITVCDRGAGIASEDQPHIFERFYRPRGERRGDSVGLGLYITRMLVEAHGGRICVESCAGEGSTFSFFLPVPDRI